MTGPELAAAIRSAMRSAPADLSREQGGWRRDRLDALLLDNLPIILDALEGQDDD